jgi:hypothetical protein
MILGQAAAQRTKVAFCLSLIFHGYTVPSAAVQAP